MGLFRFCVRSVALPRYLNGDKLDNIVHFASLLREETLNRAETVCVCVDLINLERADVALFIIDACTALNALPV